MKKTIEFTTLINGNEVQVKTEVEITEQDLADILAKKQKQLEKELAGNLTANIVTEEAEEQSFEYNKYVDEEESTLSATSEQTSGYTPYVEPQNQTESSQNQAYTPYASLNASITSSAENRPVSYHPQNENGYAAYHTFRVVVPHGFKPEGE